MVNSPTENAQALADETEALVARLTAGEAVDVSTLLAHVVGQVHALAILLQLALDRIDALEGRP